MLKNRVVKSIILITLLSVMLVYSSISSFAYQTLLELHPSDWEIDFDDTYRAKYPKRIDNNYGGSEVYNIPDFNDEYYFGSRYWVDDYLCIRESNVTLPEFPYIESFETGDDFDQAEIVVFCVEDNIFAALLWGSNFTSYIDSSGFICFDYDGDSYIGEVSYYRTVFPFTSWHFFGSDSVYGDSFEFEFSDYIDIPVDDIIWSSTTVYLSSDFSTARPKDNISYTDAVYTLTYSEPLSAVAGSASFNFSSASYIDVFTHLNSFFIDDLGFIIGTESSFVYFDYSFYVYSDGELLEKSSIFSDYLLNDIDYVPAGSYYKGDYIYHTDLGYSENDFSIGEFSFVFSFLFVSDGYNLYFPGDISVVNYDDFDEQTKHDDIVNEINGAASDICGAVADSSTIISGAITEGFDNIIHGDTGVPNVELDTGDLDSIVSEQDMIIDDILSSLDQDIIDSLPSGYSNYIDYLNDNINAFQSSDLQASFVFIQDMFDDVVSASGIMALLLFSLTFGFAIYVLGRKLS